MAELASARRMRPRHSGAGGSDAAAFSAAGAFAAGPNAQPSGDEYYSPPIVIHSHGRSGSTLLLEVLEQDPSLWTAYEPLKSVRDLPWQIMNLEGSACRDPWQVRPPASHPSLAGVSRPLTAFVRLPVSQPSPSMEPRCALRDAALLASLLVCDFSPLQAAWYQELDLAGERGQWMPEAKGAAWHRDYTRPRLARDAMAKTRADRRACLARRQRAVKTIRLNGRLGALYNVTEDLGLPKPVVLHIVRDPRGSVTLDARSSHPSRSGPRRRRRRRFQGAAPGATGVYASRKKVGGPTRGDDADAVRGRDVNFWVPNAAMGSQAVKLWASTLCVATTRDRQARSLPASACRLRLWPAPDLRRTCRRLDGGTPITTGWSTSPSSSLRQRGCARAAQPEAAASTLSSPATTPAQVIRGIYAHVLRRPVPQPVLDFIRARMPGGNRTAGAATAAAEDRWGTAARSADRVQNEWRGQLDEWELDGIEQACKRNWEARPKAAQLVRAERLRAHGLFWRHVLDGRLPPRPKPGAP